MSLAERIERIYESLPPQEQRACDALAEHAGEIALYSSTELAQIAGVSAATLSRLYRRLGYANFTELRQEERSLRSAGVPVATGHSDHAAFAAQEARHLARALENLEGGFVGEAAQLITQAKSVMVVGLRSSYPVALHLRNQLSQVLPGVRLAPKPGQSLGEDFAELGPGDLVILVAFRRRAAVIMPALRQLLEAGVSVIVMADGSARSEARKATLWLECPVDSTGPFDSYGAAMTLACALVNEVAGLLDGPGQSRVLRVQALYEAMGELEEA